MKTYQNDYEVYVNMDVKLREGGRKAVKISKEDLEEKIIDYVVSKYEEEIDMDREDIDLEECVKFLMWCDATKVHKDMKIKFDTENLDAGVCETPDGFGYIEITAGGDWQEPVRSFMYFDGKDFRLYIPTKGNVFNRSNKRAFGEDPEADEEFIFKHIESIIESSLELMEEYEMEEDLEMDDINFDDIIARMTICDAACREDFFARLEIEE